MLVGQTPRLRFLDDDNDGDDDDDDNNDNDEKQIHICFYWEVTAEVKTVVAPSINRCCRPQNCSSKSEIQQLALQF